MKRNLLAIAVAGALAVPGVALAQSSVAISGFLAMDVGNIRLSGAAAPRAGNTSEWRVIDPGSYIQFRATEDLGGGLSAIGQYQLRPTLDGNGAFNSAGYWTGAGQNYIALSSKSWGMVKVGTDWAHITLNGDNFSGVPVFALSGHLTSMIIGGAGSSAILGGTRVRNQVSYQSPNWNGFTLHTGWASRGATGQEADLTAPTGGAKLRKGNTVWITGRYTASNWFVGLSYLSDKQDPTATTATTVKGWRAAGRVDFGGGFGVGVTYDRSKRDVATAAAGTVTSASTNDRAVWAIPVDYTMGAHRFGVLYSVARADKRIANSKSRQWSLRYAYSLSKRTKVGLAYSVLRNDAGAAYNMGDNSSATSGNSSANSSTTVGEDVRSFGVRIQHTF